MAKRSRNAERVFKRWQPIVQEEDWNSLMLRS